MTKFAFKISALLEQMYTMSSKDKKLAFVLLLISTAAQAQEASGLKSVGDNMWTNAGPVYRLISVFVLLSGLFFLGKGVIEGLRGEQGAWIKIGGALLVFAVWFFAVPSLINFLSAQTTKTFNPIQ